MSFDTQKARNPSIRCLTTEGVEVSCMCPYCKVILRACNEIDSLARELAEAKKPCPECARIRGAIHLVMEFRHDGTEHHWDCPYSETNNGCSILCTKLRSALTPASPDREEGR